MVFEFREQDSALVQYNGIRYPFYYSMLRPAIEPKSLHVVYDSRPLCIRYRKYHIFQAVIAGLHYVIIWFLIPFN